MRILLYFDRVCFFESLETVTVVVAAEALPVSSVQDTDSV